MWEAFHWAHGWKTLPSVSSYHWKREKNGEEVWKEVCSDAKEFKRTSYFCPECNVRLCAVPCFCIYHQSWHCLLFEHFLRMYQLISLDEKYLFFSNKSNLVLWLIYSSKWIAWHVNQLKKTIIFGVDRHQTLYVFHIKCSVDNSLWFEVDFRIFI